MDTREEEFTADTADLIGMFFRPVCALNDAGFAANARLLAQMMTTMARVAQLPPLTPEEMRNNAQELLDNPPPAGMPPAVLDIFNDPTFQKNLRLRASGGTPETQDPAPERNE